MDRREHHRAQLRLPVRIRWNTPFGQKTEVCKTLDISRGGLLVPCQDAHAPGVRLWVTFPYDTSLGHGQPEMFAKVVRVGPAHNGNGSKAAREGASEQAVALHFALPHHAEGNDHGCGKEGERRESPRRKAMTMDASAHGLRFLGTREYQEGDRLLVSFEPTASAPWPTASETAARVLRIQARPDSAALAVTIVREA